MAEEKRTDISKLLKKSCMSGKAVMDKKIEYIYVSPSFDAVTGGIHNGSFIIVSGKYKSGKTTMILHAAKKAQDAGYHINYSNIEMRLKPRDLKQANLDLSKNKFTLIQSSEGNLLTAEDHIAICENILNTKKKQLVIQDSVSSMCSSELANADIRDRNRDSVPLLLSRFCKRISMGCLSINDNMYIGITHIIANQGMGMSTTMEASGNKIQYNADIKIKIEYASDWKEGEKKIGQNMNLKCETSTTDITPGTKAVGKLRYGIGIDEIAEIIPIAEELSIIDKAGSWYKIWGESIQGEGKLIEFLRADKSRMVKLNKEIKEIS